MVVACEECAKQFLKNALGWWKKLKSSTQILPNQPYQINHLYNYSWSENIKNIPNLFHCTVPNIQKTQSWQCDTLDSDITKNIISCLMTYLDYDKLWLNHKIYLDRPTNYCLITHGQGYIRSCSLKSMFSEKRKKNIAYVRGLGVKTSHMFRKEWWRIKNGIKALGWADMGGGKCSFLLLTQTVDKRQLNAACLQYWSCLPDRQSRTTAPVFIKQPV